MYLIILTLIVGDSRYRPEALKKSGKAQFPVLVDPNYEPPLVIVESADIVAHLWNNYGNAATVPLHCKVFIVYCRSSIFHFYNTSSINNICLSTQAADSSRLLLFLPSLFRSLPEHGLIQMPSKLPKTMLELYQFEVSPFCKMIR